MRVLPCWQLLGLALFGASCSVADADPTLMILDGEPGSGGSFGDTPVISQQPPVAQETEVPLFGVPVVTGKYLWSANPQSGKVALIDAETLSTRVLDAGLAPTHLRAVPSEEGVESAIVINVGTSDAHYFRARDEAVQSSRIPLHLGANRWKIAESGEWVVAWTSSDETGLDPTDGRQEITVVDLRGDEPQPRRLAVGYRPESVHFNAAESTLIVVSRLGISLIDLESEELTWVAVAESAGREVLVTSEGRHALVRREGSSSVQVLGLYQDTLTVELELPGEVTDLDLVDEGRVVAVCRDASILATFVLDEVLNDPSLIDTVLVQGAAVGSAEVTPSGDRAVLYTNAFESALVTIVNLGDGEDYLSYRSLDTQTPVQYIRMSPDGRHAIAVGTGAAGVSGSAFSVLSLSELRFARVFGTQSPILQVALGNEFGIVTASLPAGVHEVHLVSFEGLHVETFSLASAPLSAGLLPDLGIGFSAQNHAEGRITFFELEDVGARTLTGFELSSEIVEQ